jgi:hypothetical protein
MVIDILELPKPFYWTIEEVGAWIENLGFPQFRNAFKENFIDGRKLILVDKSGLAKMNIKNFEDIKKIASEIRKIYKIAPKNFPSKYAETFYEFYRSFSGLKYEEKRSDFFKKMQVIEEFPVKLNHFEKLHKWLLHIPNYQEYRIGMIKREILYSVPKGLVPRKEKEDKKPIEKSSKLLSEKWTSEELQAEKQLSIFDDIQNRENICERILTTK